MSTPFGSKKSVIVRKLEDEIFDLEDELLEGSERYRAKEIINKIEKLEEKILELIDPL